MSTSITMYGSNASILSRGEIKRFSQQRGWYVALKLVVLVFSLTLVIVLAWLRIDWGITNWAHHAYFSHFWSGVYIIFSGMYMQLYLCLCLNFMYIYKVCLCLRQQTWIQF